MSLTLKLDTPQARIFPAARNGEAHAYLLLSLVKTSDKPVARLS